MKGTREVVGGKAEGSRGVLEEVPLGAVEEEGPATGAGGRADPEAMGCRDEDATANEQGESRIVSVIDFSSRNEPESRAEGDDEPEERGKVLVGVDS